MKIKIIMTKEISLQNYWFIKLTDQIFMRFPYCSLKFLFFNYDHIFTERRRNGVTVSEDCPSRLPDLPSWDWKKVSLTPKTGDRRFSFLPNWTKTTLPSTENWLRSPLNSKLVRFGNCSLKFILKLRIII